MKPGRERYYAGEKDYASRRLIYFFMSTTTQFYFVINLHFIGCAWRIGVSTIRVSEWDQERTRYTKESFIPSAHADGTDFAEL
jgi:hypothetical protein